MSLVSCRALHDVHLPDGQLLSIVLPGLPAAACDARLELLWTSLGFPSQQNPPSACAAGVYLDQQWSIFCTPDGQYTERDGRVCPRIVQLPTNRAASPPSVLYATRHQSV